MSLPQRERRLFSICWLTRICSNHCRSCANRSNDCKAVHIRHRFLRNRQNKHTRQLLRLLVVLFWFGCFCCRDSNLSLRIARVTSARWKVCLKIVPTFLSEAKICGTTVKCVSFHGTKNLNIRDQSCHKNTIRLVQTSLQMTESETDSPRSNATSFFKNTACLSSGSDKTTAIFLFCDVRFKNLATLFVTITEHILLRCCVQKQRNGGNQRNCCSQDNPGQSVRRNDVPTIFLNKHREQQFVCQWNQCCQKGGEPRQFSDDRRLHWALRLWTVRETSCCGQGVSSSRRHCPLLRTDSKPVLSCNSTVFENRTERGLLQTDLDWIAECECFHEPKGPCQHSNFAQERFHRHWSVSKLFCLSEQRDNSLHDHWPRRLCPKFPMTYRKSLHDKVWAFVAPEVLFDVRFSPSPAIEVFSVSVMFFWFLNRSLPFVDCLKNYSLELTFQLMCCNMEVEGLDLTKRFQCLDESVLSFYKEAKFTSSVPNWQKTLNREGLTSMEAGLIRTVARSGIVMEQSSRVFPQKMLQIVCDSLSLRKQVSECEVDPECIQSHVDFHLAQECNFPIDARLTPFKLNLDIRRKYEHNHLSKVLLCQRETDIRNLCRGVVLNKQEHMVLNSMILKEFVSHASRNNNANVLTHPKEIDVLRKTGGEVIFPGCFDLVEGQFGKGDEHLIKVVEHIVSENPRKNPFEQFKIFCSLLQENGSNEEIRKAILRTSKNTWPKNVCLFVLFLFSTRTNRRKAVRDMVATFCHAKQHFFARVFCTWFASFLDLATLDSEASQCLTFAQVFVFVFLAACLERRWSGKHPFRIAPLYTDVDQWPFAKTQLLTHKFCVCLALGVARILTVLQTTRAKDSFKRCFCLSAKGVKEWQPPDGAEVFGSPKENLWANQPMVMHHGLLSGKKCRREKCHDRIFEFDCRNVSTGFFLCDPWETLKSNNLKPQTLETLRTEHRKWLKCHNKNQTKCGQTQKRQLVFAGDFSELHFGWFLQWWWFWHSWWQSAWEMMLFGCSFADAQQLHLLCSPLDSFWRIGSKPKWTCCQSHLPMLVFWASTECDPFGFSTEVSDVSFVVFRYLKFCFFNAIVCACLRVGLKTWSVPSHACVGFRVRRRSAISLCFCISRQTLLQLEKCTSHNVFQLFGTSTMFPKSRQHTPFSVWQHLAKCACSNSACDVVFKIAIHWNCANKGFREHLFQLHGLSLSLKNSNIFPKTKSTEKMEKTRTDFELNLTCHLLVGIADVLCSRNSKNTLLALVREITDLLERNNLSCLAVVEELKSLLEDFVLWKAKTFADKHWETKLRFSSTRLNTNKEDAVFDFANVGFVWPMLLLLSWHLLFLISAFWGLVSTLWSRQRTLKKPIGTNKKHCLCELQGRAWSDWKIPLFWLWQVARRLLSSDSPDKGQNWKSFVKAKVRSWEKITKSVVWHTLSSNSRQSGRIPTKAFRTRWAK